MGDPSVRGVLRHLVGIGAASAAVLFALPVSADGAVPPATAWLPTGWVDVEATPAGNGYWVLAANGSVQGFGDANNLGGTGTLPAGESAVSISSTASGDGYWLFTDTGRVVVRGAAASFGDASSLALNGPIVDSIATPSGRGYYLVASDGGVFAYGDAHFAGSTGGMRLNAPIESLVPDPDGAGYWLVASDGGVFSFDAAFRGSMGGTQLSQPVTGIVSYGDGYVLVGGDGGAFVFSDKPFTGSLGSSPSDSPVVAITARPQGDGYWMLTSAGRAYPFGAAPDVGSPSHPDPVCARSIFRTESENDIDSSQDVWRIDTEAATATKIGRIVGGLLGISESCSTFLVRNVDQLDTYRIVAGTLTRVASFGLPSIGNVLIQFGLTNDGTSLFYPFGITDVKTIHLVNLGDGRDTVLGVFPSTTALYGIDVVNAEAFTRPALAGSRTVRPGAPTVVVDLRSGATLARVAPASSRADAAIAVTGHSAAWAYVYVGDQQSDGVIPLPRRVEMSTGKIVTLNAPSFVPTPYAPVGVETLGNGTIAISTVGNLVDIDDRDGNLLSTLDLASLIGSPSKVVSGVIAGR